MKRERVEGLREAVRMAMSCGGFMEKSPRRGQWWNKNLHGVFNGV